MFSEICKEEKEEAIQYLMNNIPKDCLKKVLIAIRNRGPTWQFLVHWDFGMYVRNTLRKNGFDWGDYALDDLWGTLIEEAARRMEPI